MNKSDKSSTPSDPVRLLILGAHPDDAEYHAGGLACVYRSLGREVKMVSVTNGAAGHHNRPPEELIRLRREEAAAAGGVIGATYETWDFPDGHLEPTLDVRSRVIREIRTFKPDLVLTHRTCDYHPDHRAVGQVVQDASYMVKVPHVVPEVPALKRDPVVACMTDLFTRPAPMSVDVAFDIADQIDKIVAMLACHRSQVFEWLPHEEGILDKVPTDPADKREWLRTWYAGHIRIRADRFRQSLIAMWGEKRGRAIEYAEVYEISEYATQPDEPLRRRLFPCFERERRSVAGTPDV